MPPVDREALLFRQSVPPVPGSAGSGQNEQGNGDKDGIELNTPRGIVQNQSDERRNGNRESKAQGDPFDAPQIGFLGEEGGYECISGEEKDKRQSEDDA